MTGGKKMRGIIFKALPFIILLTLLFGLLACGQAEPGVPAKGQPTTPAATGPAIPTATQPVTPTATQPTTPATTQTATLTATPPATPTASQPAATETGEPDYARVATETTLQGLSEDNLEKYTRYADEQFKAAVTQQILDTTSKQINSQLGAYESVEFLSVEKQGEYTIVHYKAKYTRGEVGVRMVFDADHLVAGQWFE
jgi:hypothetical protein